MAESRLEDEEILAEELSILVCNSIQEDNLCELQAFMKKYEKSQRQVIVSKTINGSAPLFIACQQGKVHHVNYLLDDCNANIEQKGIFEGAICAYEVTPLWCAAVAGKLDIVETLVQHGAEINCSSFTGVTPVMAACSMKNVSVTKYLVEHGANIDKRNNDGETCLMHAIKNADLCSFLINNGADVNAQDNSNNTALHFASSAGGIDTVRLLLQHKSNCSLKNIFDDDALQIAALRGNSCIVEIILEMAQLTVSNAIRAFELLGANFVDEQNDMDGALYIWSKAMSLRYDCSFAPILKQLPERRSVYLYLKEPETMEELNDLIDPEEILMNSLMIRERILGPTHTDTVRGIMSRGAHYADSHMYQRCVDLWKYAYKLRNHASQPFNDESIFIIESLVKLFWDIQMEDETGPVNSQVSINDILDVLNIVSEQIKNGHTYIKTSFEYLQTELLPFMQMLLEQFLHLIHLISRLENVDEHTRWWYMTIIHKIIVQDPRGTEGKSLLHLAVDPNISVLYNELHSSFYSLDVIKILVRCGANVDALKNDGNSPLFDCIRFYNLFHLQEHADILEYLISNGAHVDICNGEGECALSLIEKMALPFSTTNYVSLKCLASRVIMKHKIPYKEVVPKALSPFVELHGKRDKA